MKLASIIGLWALVCVGCSSRPIPPGFASDPGDDGVGSSGAATVNDAGSSGGGSGGGSSSGAGPSGSGGGAASSGSSGSSGGTASDDGGGLQTSSQADAATGDNAEIDYTQTKTLTMDTFPVPANSEVFYCQTFANPWGQQVDIKTYDLTMDTGSHHMFAFYQSNATDAPVAMCPAGGLTYGAFTFLSQTPKAVMTFPDTVGATLPTSTGFNLMVHYLNTGTTQLTAHVSLTMYVAKSGAVTNHAGVIFDNNATMTVPVGSAPYVSTAVEHAGPGRQYPGNLEPHAQVRPELHGDVHASRRSSPDALYDHAMGRAGAPRVLDAPPPHIRYGHHVVLHGRQHDLVDAHLRRVCADERHVHLGQHLLPGRGRDQPGPGNRHRRLLTGS